VLAAVGLPAGRQLLIGLDDSSLCRWDLDRREMIGQPARVGRWAHIVATYVDAAGTATAFLYVPGDDDNPVTRVEQWRLDDGTRLEPVFPETLSAVFDDGGVTWGVLGERDGSLEVRPLDGAGPGLPASDRMQRPPPKGETPRSFSQPRSLIAAVPGIAVMSHTGPVALAADSVGRQLQSPAGRHRQARRPRVAGPSDQALNRLAGLYAIALRLGGAVLFSAVALLAATRQVSGWWLGVALTVLCLWSACFTWRVRRSGLTAAVVLADAAVIAALELAQEHLVPAVLINDTTTWMLPLACTSVYILQLAPRPWTGLSGAAVVIIAYGLGVYHPADAWLLAVETIVAAGLVAVIRGGARQADTVVAAGLVTERRIRAEEARRADEQEQHRQLHDTVLSTLTMVAAGAFAGPAAALTAQAARDLRVLQGLEGAPAMPAGPAAAGGPVPLTDLRPGLEQAAASTDDLAVRLELVPVTLPSPVADQLAACVGEALRNVEQHAGTGQAEVTVAGGAGWAVVKVTDRGRGFDPAATPPSRRGIRESITGRMLAAGGRVAIASRPGAGTTVTMSWPA
jgi:signal transduction histidine kinase